jgi:hypothetical protein
MLQPCRPVAICTTRIAAARRTGQNRFMLYLVIKAALSGVIVAAVSEIARRNPGAGGLLASLPLVSVLGMIWLWRDTHDPVRMAAHAEATFWYVLPSLPMFLLIPLMLRSGVNFWIALLAGCLLTMALYAAMILLGPRLGLRL